MSKAYLISSDGLQRCACSVSFAKQLLAMGIVSLHSNAPLAVKFHSLGDASECLLEPFSPAPFLQHAAKAPSFVKEIA